MHRPRLIVLAPALALLAGCAAPVPTPPPAPPAPSELPTFQQVGTASWYGRAHHGRRTANGERYDMRAMTAAHRSLPFDTVVRVTNLGNGKSVNVRINDRGPYVKGRIIDLSARAAELLEIDEDGTARVRLEAYASDQPAE